MTTKVLSIDSLRHVLENPDGCDLDDLRQASHTLIAVYGYKKAAELLGEPYSIRGLRMLWHYIDLTVMVRAHRLNGRQNAADYVEKAADDLYNRLPKGLKW